MSVSTPIQRTRLNDITNNQNFSPEATPRTSKLNNLKRRLEIAQEEQNQVTPKKQRQSVARLETRIHYFEGLKIWSFKLSICFWKNFEQKKWNLTFKLALLFTNDTIWIYWCYFQIVFKIFKIIRYFFFFQTATHEVLEGLFIGTSLTAKNKEALTARGITHILSIDDTKKPLLSKLTCKILK